MIFSTATVPVYPSGERKLTREQVWAGLVLKARDARFFLPPGACTKCEVVAEGKDFIVREAVIMKDEITEIVTFAPKRKVSFHQVKSPREGVIVNEILEDAGELQLRFYAYLGLLGVAPGSEQERQEKALLDSEDRGYKAALLSTFPARQLIFQFGVGGAPVWLRWARVHAQPVRRGLLAHHPHPPCLRAGNRVDGTTVTEVVRDLVERFAFRRVLFVGDRGMVSEDNLTALQADGHGYLVGLRRRRNSQVDAWLQQVDESRWVDCPMGISARERKQPLRTRGQEVSGPDSPQRVFVIDSDERRQYEQAKREQAMERTRVRLAKLQQRVADGKLIDLEQIGAAATRALQAHHGYRYYRWQVRHGVFHYEEDPVRLPQEKRLEGRYVIATAEKDIRLLDAVAWYKQLMDVERSFRHLKDVLAMRPIYHQVEPRVKAHIFVAALALLVQRLLERRLDDAGVDLSATQALQTVETVRLVNFRVDTKRRRGVSTPSGRARQVLKAVGITETGPPTPPEGPAEVM